MFTLGGRRGFTLIELLVVIAIIGILAAMLFPVFARAREAARKTQCLANVKNIAMAMQLYIADFDQYPPKETRREIIDYHAGYDSDTHVQWGSADAAAWSNPYLRWPVVLDEYTKSRDIWRCPSGKFMNSFVILNHLANGYGDWWAWRMEVESQGSYIYAYNNRPFPPGWGGQITDSYAQGETSATAGTASNAFEQNLNGIGANYGLKESMIQDPARWLTVIETGMTDEVWEMAQVAFPDICQWQCTTCSWYLTDDMYCPDTCAEYCPWIVDCRAGDTRYVTDPSFRKPAARHMGGVNLGFADGHAKWFLGDAVITGSRNHSRRSAGTGGNFPTQSINEVLFQGPLYMCKMPPDQH